MLKPDTSYILEQLGSGVPRILKAYGKKAFLITDNYLTVILPFAHGFDEDVHQDVYQERADRIIEHIKENPKIRQIDIAKKLGVNAKTIYRQMAEMEEVIYVGNGSNGHWEITHNER